jgi:transcriptional regulator with XRE-family HTH domain
LRIRYYFLVAGKKPKAIAPAPLEDRTPGELLREARNRHGLSQRQLAIRAGTTQSAIARIEHDRTSPSIKTLTNLFQAMEEDFVFGAKPRDWGADLTLNHKNLAFTPTERVERGLGVSDVFREVKGQIGGRQTLEKK